MSLWQIVWVVGDIVNGYYDGLNDSVIEIMEVLECYSEIIMLWVMKVVENFIVDIVCKNDEQWWKYSKIISCELCNLVSNVLSGQVMKFIVVEQVKYIKLLFFEVVDRVYDIQNWVIEVVVIGGRVEYFVKEIVVLGDIVKFRVDFIVCIEFGCVIGVFDQV